MFIPRDESLPPKGTHPGFRGRNFRRGGGDGIWTSPPREPANLVGCWPRLRWGDVTPACGRPRPHQQTDQCLLLTRPPQHGIWQQVPAGVRLSRGWGQRFFRKRFFPPTPRQPVAPGRGKSAPLMGPKSPGNSEGRRKSIQNPPIRNHLKGRGKKPQDVPGLPLRGRGAQGTSLVGKTAPGQRFQGMPAAPHNPRGSPQKSSGGAPKGVWGLGGRETTAPGAGGARGTAEIGWRAGGTAPNAMVADMGKKPGFDHRGR